MKASWLTVALCSYVLINAPVYGQTSNDLIGTWHNESQSTIRITAIAPSGQITGTYISQPGTPGQVFPLFGWVKPIADGAKGPPIIPVLFRVKGGAYGTITVWSGYLSKGKDSKLSITTIWDVIRAYADPDSSPDNGTVNFAVFKPGPAH
jgi:hypothetical protein